MNRFDQCELFVANCSGICMPKKFKSDLTRFLYLVNSFTIVRRMRIRRLFSRTPRVGTYKASRSPFLNCLANLLLSTLSVLRFFSLSVVGTSAGLTTMLFTPRDRKWSWIQKPQNPASYTLWYVPLGKCLDKNRYSTSGSGGWLNVLWYRSSE